ncbi:MAG: hypothetical protein Kow0010_05130 [Dehalococcoidia bacterium]
MDSTSRSLSVERVALWAVALALTALVALTARPAAPAEAAASTFRFKASAYNVTEGQTAQLVVERTSGSGAFNVPYSITPGTASAADIFGLSGGAVSFGAGDNERILFINTFDDADIEGNEQFTVTLQNAPDVTIQDPASATVTILDNDGPSTYDFSAASYEIFETGTATITVLRSGGTSTPGSVQYTTADGTATAPTHYNTSSGTLNFAAGETSKTFTVTTKSVDMDRTVTLQLSNPQPGGSAAGANATLTIKDTAAGIIEFTTSSYSITEGDPATITLKRTAGFSGAVSVQCKTVADGTATAGVDYTTTTQTINWADGDSANKTCTIPTSEDASPESSETVSLQVDTPTGGAVIGSQSTATLTILDDDAASSVQFSATAYTVAEGGTATITVTRTGSTSVQATVNYATSPGTATQGADYVHVAGTLTFPIGSTSQTFTVTTLQDSTVEVNETITLTLSSPSSATLGTPSTATLTIHDDDGPDPIVTSVSPDSGTVAGGTTVVITGQYFTNASSVKFGFSEATSFTVDSDTKITAVTPAHTAGPVGVIVTTPAGTSNTDVTFTFTGAGPTITSISPTSGPTAGGTTVTVTGTNFLGATQVTIGGTAVSFTIHSATSISFVTPAKSAGTVDIRVTTPSGTSPNTSADNFTYTDQAQTITYMLSFRWTLLVWNGKDNIAARDALQGIESPDNPATNNVYLVVTAIFSWNASAQVWLGYFPQAERDGLPGVNDFTTLKNGTAYWFAVTVSTNWTVIEG